MDSAAFPRQPLVPTASGILAQVRYGDGIDAHPHALIRRALMISRPLPRPRSRAARACFTAIVCIAFAFAGCTDPMGPLPREGAPDELHFSIGGFGTGTTVVELDDEGLAVTRIPWNPEPGVTIVPVHVVPSAQAWSDFWAAAEKAGVRRWRNKYVAEDVVDGAGWSLRIKTGDVVIDSFGSNAWPDSRGREHELDVTADFQAFLEAVGTLAGQDF
jgi:hypothetical protein